MGLDVTSHTSHVTLAIFIVVRVAIALFAFFCVNALVLLECVLSRKILPTELACMAHQGA